MGDNANALRLPPRKISTSSAEPMDWEEAEPDFDDNDDPDMSGEYCKDIFYFESQREMNWIITLRYCSTPDHISLPNSLNMCIVKVFNRKTLGWKT